MNDASHPAPQDAALLDHFEIRVLAVLAEKEALTPDTYPLSLNALTNGCNQLSSRDPVMEIQETTVQQVLQRLIEKRLASEVYQAGARVPKYEHRLRIAWSLPQDKLALLTTLMLRGAQTAGELRARSGRLHEFADLAEVERGLQFLIDKYPPLVARLTRAPGSKEARYAHLLAGADLFAQSVHTQSVQPEPAAAPETADERIGRLERELAEMRAQVEALQQQFEQFRRQFD